MFNAAEQIEMMADMATHQAIVDGLATISIKFRRKPAVAQFTDGTVETYQPYCLVTAFDVSTNEIETGMTLEIAEDDWKINSVSQLDSGFYKLEVSKS